RSRRYAGLLLRLGVAPGDRVAVVSRARLELLEVLLGNYRVGAVHLPINDRYGAGELEHILRDSGARLVVTDLELSERLAQVDYARTLDWLRIDGPKPEEVAAAPLPWIAGRAEVDAQAPVASGIDALVPTDADLALMIYTSGTTGPAKGVCLEHRAVVGAIDALTTMWRWSPRDCQVLALPLFHVHGLCIGVHGALIHGVPTTLLSSFEAERIVAAFDQGATLFMGVPTMYSRLLEHLD